MFTKIILSLPDGTIKSFDGNSEPSSVRDIMAAINTNMHYSGYGNHVITYVEMRYNTYHNERLVIVDLINVVID